MECGRPAAAVFDLSPHHTRNSGSLAPALHKLPRTVRAMPLGREPHTAKAKQGPKLREKNRPEGRPLRRLREKNGSEDPACGRQAATTKNQTVRGASEIMAGCLTGCVPARR